MLINLNVDIEQINDEGVAAVFHLFQPERPQDFDPSTEFLQILAAKDFLGFDSTHSEARWCPLHRASAYGTSLDVDFLIRRGASTESVDFYCWTPLFIATGYKNIHTFNRLMEAFRPEYINLQDQKGWNLLHVAIDAGNPDMISSLIRHGFEPRPLQSRFHSKETADVRLAPGDLASSLGEDIYTNFISGLHMAGMQVSADSEDIFWPLDSS